MTVQRSGSNQNGLRAYTPQAGAQTKRYYVELPQELLDDQGSLLDLVISLMFDTLQVQRLDLRIVAAARPVGCDIQI
jgi:hypothetical protein